MPETRPEPRTSARSARAEAHDPRQILSVSDLNRLIGGLIERAVPQIWVRGELSNFTRAASGHCYFSLKDRQAQVRAVMFRSRVQQLDFSPREGMLVEVAALPGLYEARGEFQLNVEAMRRAGAGDLYQRFLQIRDRLQGEGLFDPARKRPLPAWPRRLGIVTSPAAAALRDVVRTLEQRAPGLDVILYPTLVQGADAPAAIVEALGRAARRAEVDVLLVVRGGGSIEDLWAFNDEAVARAIAAMPMPVVSGVGHETDTTIADFVADRREATPTAAAAAATPDRRALLEQLGGLSRALVRAGARELARREQGLDQHARLLRPPSAHWRRRHDQWDALRQRLARGLAADAAHRAQRLTHLTARLRAPALDRHEELLARLARGLARSATDGLQRREVLARQLAIRLEAASPRQILRRGFAIVRDDAGQIVRQAAATAPGQVLSIEFDDAAIGVRRDGKNGSGGG